MIDPCAIYVSVTDELFRDYATSHQPTSTSSHAQPDQNPITGISGASGTTGSRLEKRFGNRLSR
jgi:hypothetical protein